MSLNLLVSLNLSSLEAILGLHNTHAHMHACTQMHAHTHTHHLTHIHTHTHTISHTYTHTHTHTELSHYWPAFVPSPKQHHACTVPADLCVCSMMQATDPDLGDNGTVRYFIDSGVRVPFAMTLDSGLLYTTEEFSTEFSTTTQLQYRFGINARDMGALPLTTSTDFIVS